MDDVNAAYWRPHEEFQSSGPQMTTAVKAILFIDFELTMTVGNGWYFSRIFMSTKLLDDAIMLQIFGSEKYIRRLRKFWRDLHAIPGLEVQILSGCLERLLFAILDRLDLEPKPRKSIGKETLKRMKCDKPAYVKQEIAQRNVQYVFFVDDKFSEREEMQRRVKQVEVCCDSLYSGLTDELAEEILAMIRRRLN
jgi:hypothetical protein